MKKTLLLALSVLALPAWATQPGQCGPGFQLWDLNCDGKLTSDEAKASMKAYREHVDSVHQPAAREGLPPPSSVGYPDNGYQTTGRWVQIGTRTIKTANAGPYSQLLTPNSVGQACLKGTKGLLMATERECVRWNSGGWQCQQYSDPVAVASYGYKAECR
ncbi:hypothetical protein [Vibrio sp. TBV020]|uniref:hypothetical protein n=1 Tax=Vibrio sp. TBV020 TaxID=3137398 RepID=UPI0038CD6BBE